MLPATSQSTRSRRPSLRSVSKARGPVMEGERSAALRRRARLASRIGGRLEVHIGAERSRIGERQDLRRPVSADPVLSIDSVEQVVKGGPAERPGRPAGRRVRVVHHEGLGPGFLQAEEELVIVRYGRNDDWQHGDRLMRLQAVAYSSLD